MTRSSYERAKSPRRSDDVFQRDFVIETRWPPTVAAIEIQKRMAAPATPRQGDEPFLGGSLSKTEFRFSRASSGRNNLLPVIDAAVLDSDRNGARVEVRVRLNGTLLVMIGFTIAVAMVGAVAAGVSGLWWLAACPLLIAGCKAYHAAFKREARQAEAILREIFARAPALPPPYDTEEPYR
jgi:hypothetical protein